MKYIVVSAHIVGNIDNWGTCYDSSMVRYSNKKTAIRTGIKTLGHDDFLIATLENDVIVGISWQYDERDPEDFMEEAPEMSAALGLQWREPRPKASESPAPYTVEQLAREGHGAIQVDLPEAGNRPPVVMLGGPIKFWWSLPDSEWGEGDHGVYLQWRDAVEAALVKAGFLVYCPYKALRGSWTPLAQQINDKAIEVADAFIYLTPPGVPDEGTQEELAHAMEVATVPFYLPPGDLEDIEGAIQFVRDLFLVKQ